MTCDKYVTKFLYPLVFIEILNSVKKLIFENIITILNDFEKAGVSIYNAQDKL